MSITQPRGFRAAGLAAGIKADGRTDLALVVNDGPRRLAAGVFTSNRVYAAPVRWSRQVVADGRLSAVLLNSGGANAGTGEPGYRDSVASAQRVAELLGCPPEEVAVCSTGLIGERLPMTPLLAGVVKATQALSPQGGDDAARAIMTTDTRPKQAVLDQDGYTIAGMAKGAGMLAPSLATMLVVLTTDADVSQAQLDSSLRIATSLTFDRLDSDGCMSTNDTALILASGASGVVPDADAFTAALARVCADLAQQLLADAEGSAHDIAIEVVGAASEDDALEVGRAVARNNLFKCAIFGNDPNWGRVLAAIGTTDAAFNAEELDVSINGVMVCRGCQIGEDRELVDLSPRACQVRVDLHAGSAAATIYTNDLTYDYVKENAEYSS